MPQLEAMPNRETLARVRQRGRDTTIVRSNLLLPENHYSYEDSLRRWESPSQDLNYNVMYSARGVTQLAYSDNEMVALAQRGNAVRVAGIVAELCGAPLRRLDCPFCGARELEEFRFHKTLAEPGANACDEVYLRVNRLTMSCEHWQHVKGCRAWLLVRRNPSDGTVLDVRLAASGDALAHNKASHEPS
jgi:sarcosine oxidase delta subunit